MTMTPLFIGGIGMQDVVDQMFANSFFQIPNRFGYPHLRLCNSPLLELTRGLHPLNNAHTNGAYY